MSAPAAAAMLGVMAELSATAQPMLPASALAPKKSLASKQPAAPAAIMAADGSAEAALSALTASGRGFLKWSAKASTALLDGWNEMMLESIASPQAFDGCCRAHFGPYQPQPDIAGGFLVWQCSPSRCRSR